MLKMALRNIFRNRKRSILTVTVIFIGIAGVVTGMSWISGVGRMFLNEGTKFTGEIRITRPDFDLKERSLDVSSNFSLSEAEAATLQTGGIKSSGGRIKFGGAVFGKDNDDTAIGTGISESDFENMRLNEYLYEGRMPDFSSTDPEIIVGEKLKNSLGLGIGDEVTVLTSTQYSEMSAFNYTITGFYKMDNSRLNKSFFMKLSDAQYLLNMDGFVTEYVIYANDLSSIGEIREVYRQKLSGGEFLVRSWNEMGMNRYLTVILPLIKFFFALVLSLLSGVGIANTMVMTVFERKKEIGVLKSMGMKNFQIFGLLSLEGVMLGIAGTAAGIILGSSVSYYFSVNGIVIGDMVERITDEMNIKSTIYMSLEAVNIVYAFLLGVSASFLATAISVMPEIKKESVENLRN